MSAWQSFLTRVRRAVRAFESDRSDTEAHWTFVVQLTPDELDGGWVADCPAFPGAVAQGETEKEALEALTAVLTDVITLRIDDQVTSAPVHAPGGEPYKVALTV